MLGLDVSTLVFQVVNFLILLAVLGRFFYRPVVAAMRRKEEETAERLERADRRMAEVEGLRAEAEQAKEDALRQAQQRLVAVAAEAKGKRERLVAQARDEAAAVLAQAKASIATERELAASNLEAEVRSTAVAMATQLVERLAGESMHHILVTRLLGEGVDEDQGEVGLFGRGGPARVEVETAYALQDSEQTALHAMLTKRLKADDKLVITYHERPDLVAGLRILLPGSVIDMSMAGAIEAIQPAGRGKVAP